MGVLSDTGRTRYGVIDAEMILTKSWQIVNTIEEVKSGLNHWTALFLPSPIVEVTQILCIIMLLIPLESQVTWTFASATGFK